MDITVFRPNQIGGCITEIKSKEGTRIIIDVGSNLPGIEGELIDIDSLTKDSAGVFITHYHGDHVGEYRSVHKGTDIYMGEIAKKIFFTLQTRLSRNDKTGVTAENLAKIEFFKTFNHGVPIKVNDITVTPIRTDHSAFDSYMLLVDDGEKRILHTGDFRNHGKVGEDSLMYIKEYVRDVDALIIEGTMLSRNNEGVITEEQLSEEAAGLMNNSKYVFIMCSSTNIDRIAAFYRANKASENKIFVSDDYQKTILDIASENSAEYGDYYNFSGSVAFNKEMHYDEMYENGFCMLVRRNRFSEKFLNSKRFQNGRLFIYSQWSGYLEGRTRDEEIARIVPDDRISLHTSGHATEEAICEICRMVGAPIILPIHSERADRFEDLKTEGRITGEVRRLENGVGVRV